MTTKKEFKQLCDMNHVYGRGNNRINAIFFGWQSNEQGRGFEYAVATSVENCTKSELFNHFYEWVINGVDLPYYCYYKQALTDADRFKVGISFNLNSWS